MTASGGGRAREWAAWIVPVVAALLLYLPSLRYQFTFDDTFQVLPRDLETRTFKDVWTQPYWWPTGYGGLYRPMATVVFWVENRQEVSLAVRHGVNILLHAGVTLLVVAMARRLGLGAPAAGGAGLLFALHPVHVEAVAGLVGRAELIAAGFTLLALWFHDRGGFPGRAVWTVGVAAVLAFLAIGAKESALALPIYAAGLDLARRRRILERVAPYVGFTLGLFVHLLLRRSVLGAWLNDPRVPIHPFDNPLVSLHGVDRFLGSLRVLGLDLLHLVLPVRLSPDYSGPNIDLGGGIADPRLWAGVVLLVGPAALVLWARKRRSEAWAQAVTAAGAWLVVSVVLFMNLLFPIGAILADRLLYWPSVAWVLLVAALWQGIRRRCLAAATGALVVLLAAGYGARTARYLPAWHDNRTLFEYAIHVAPRSARVWFNLGDIDRVEGKLEAAITSYRRARDIDPTYHFAWSHEGIALIQLARYDEAETAIERALHYSPGDFVSMVNEGVIWAERGDYAQATKHYRRALAMRPRYAEGLINLARAEDRLGNYEAAANAWERYLNEAPGDYRAKNDLAWLLAVQLGRPAEAEALSRAAVAGDPQDPQHHDTLAEVLFRLGRREEAVAAARQAAALDSSAYFQEQIRRFEAETPGNR